MTLRHFDFRIAPLGRNVLLRPLTTSARHWLTDNLPPGERRLPASQALILEDRINATLTALLRDGLTIAPLEPTK